MQEVNALKHNEFIGDLSEITGSSNTVIENELDRFFEILCKNKFDCSPMFSTRDFVHVYEFQKHFIHESIRFFMEYVKIMQQHFWTRIKDFNAWIILSKAYSNPNLWEMSLEAADLVMNYPNNRDEFCRCIKKMSKFICVLLNDRLEKENIVDVKMVYE
ncbi:uncharacterized protein LOC129567856 [Sitodiplosis mosellana]|uniref:uncharacterized protein LOC129567856 n=1 Tax=Sitodiplosis mosellana TaxID=263140 RepID=UPI002444E576|nr:uncharacterized protein LOC129567856 [Sitodiplosis mosellana]